MSSEIKEFGQTPDSGDSEDQTEYAKSKSTNLNSRYDAHYMGALSAI